MFRKQRQPAFEYSGSDAGSLAPARGRKFWFRFIGTVLIISICCVFAYTIYLAVSLSRISTNPLGLSGLAIDPAGRTNVLVLGVGDEGHSGKGLSDTMMLMIMDDTLGRVAQVSIPRDLQVNIPDYGIAKVNAAHAFGGPALAKTVVGETLGTSVPYYVRTNFTGLKSIVDVAGGLDITVKERLYDSQYPCDDDQYKVCGLAIEPGKQHMDGSRVLQYVRCRKGTCGNDFGRSARQQEVLNLLKDKIVAPSMLLNPVKLMALATAMRQFVETDMGAVQLLQFASQWKNFSDKQPSVQLVLSTSADGLLRSTGSGYLVPQAGDFSVIDYRIDHIFSE